MHCAKHAKAVSNEQKQKSHTLTHNTGEKKIIRKWNESEQSSRVCVLI